ncbi:hypothetical protein ABI_40330 [Asticcacaulis biprosthecium C19]|uniref:Lipoprotein n=1 Tax=Asticcacaulis biprosthecium C19 TaxID=715226 RepID=F4QS96_9CAUL|nr:hypothetical protein [Asticcacaulis biprosthecium]EGF89616.1 hypothetical protein ABI_40330 [Asticcacaulis biprosthecium C19]
MRAVIKKFAFAVLSLGMLAMAGAAAAGCNSGCAPPPPAKPPHNPKPPHVPCGGGGCGGGGHHGGNNGGGKTNVNVNVNVKATATASGSGSGSGSGAVYGGGYGNWSQTPGYPQALGLNVETGAAAARLEAYTEQQTFTKTTVIRATCIDDRGAPHPASQVFGERDIRNEYRGEIFRCIAGTKLQWVYADYNGEISFDHGMSNDCRKGDALWFEEGRLTCRPQTQQRNCNERSLLRRFGVGVKILTLTRTETITKQREVAVAREASSSSYMVFDGGVGGFVQ